MRMKDFDKVDLVDIDEDFSDFGLNFRAIVGTTSIGALMGLLLAITIHAIASYSLFIIFLTLTTLFFVSIVSYYTITNLWKETFKDSFRWANTNRSTPVRLTQEESNLLYQAHQLEKEIDMIEIFGKHSGIESESDTSRTELVNILDKMAEERKGRAMHLIKSRLGPVEVEIMDYMGLPHEKGVRLRFER